MSALIGQADEIRRRLAIVHGRIDAAARLTGRSGSDITLVAVTKTHPAETVSAAIEAGLTEFGDNYAQEAAEKISSINIPVIRWHFIGHLQSNKSHLIANRCALVQTVDRIKIAQALGKAAMNANYTQEVLVQLRLGEEETKSGVEASQLVRLCETLTEVPGIRLRGLMGIAPLRESNGAISEPSRYFDQAKIVFDRLNMEKCDILSLGMSGDYESAILAGSTMVRVGSAIFGQRSPLTAQAMTSA